MKVIGIIPVRFQSTRFPGKPLANILGKPMIWWTYQQVKKVDGLDDVIVATDDRHIWEECERYGMNCTMTSHKHQCGTERVAEVASRISADYYLNVQGDEPIVEPENLKKLVDFQLSHEEYDVCTLRKRIENPMDAVNTTVSKVVCNSKSEIVYISRQAIPFPKASIDYNYYCAMGIYIFSNNALDIYRNEGKEGFESAEDIELLRLVNNDIKIYSIVVDSESVSVDTHKDLMRVESILTERGIRASGEDCPKTQMHNRQVKDSIKDMSRDSAKVETQSNNSSRIEQKVGTNCCQKQFSDSLGGVFEVWILFCIPPHNLCRAYLGGARHEI